MSRIPHESFPITSENGEVDNSLYAASGHVAFRGVPPRFSLGQCSSTAIDRPTWMKETYQIYLPESEEGSPCSVKERQNSPAKRLYLVVPGTASEPDFAAPEGGKYLWCQITGTELGHELCSMLHRCRNSTVCSQRWKDIFEMGMAASCSIEAMQGQILHLVRILFEEFIFVENQLSTSTGVTTHRRMSSAVARLLNSIHTDFANHDCLLIGHAVAGLSRNRLIQRFTAEIGTTPGRYLWKYRTLRGIELLKRSDLPIADIASACGFKDVFHFSKLVKKHCGQCPRDTRR